MPAFFFDIPNTSLHLFLDTILYLPRRSLTSRMLSVTPPVADLNRVRLRQLASWIRDELDPMIAQEGPEILRANDVLMLHEFFQALRISPTITALDLRATGIHRAVLEVAGTATRWPGRLADDCDRIVFAWQKKFGKLEDLRPFMYGRGGRLESIAKFGELSSAVSAIPHFVFLEHHPNEIVLRSS